MSERALPATATDAPSGADASEPTEMTIDEIAAATGVPSRTIREYQRLSLLPPPRRDGRLGRYGEDHQRRLGVIARLQDRGYSLAAIGDLLESWEAGRGLGSVLGANADPAVLDEMPTELTVQELVELAPCLALADLRGRLAAASVLVERDDDRVVVRSVALVEMIGLAERAGMPTDAAVGLASCVAEGAASIARAVVDSFLDLVWSGRSADPDLDAVFGRARLLLAQSSASLVVARLGDALISESRQDPELAALVERIRIGAIRTLPAVGPHQVAS
ncbi:MAG: MerR family transcriptional regulator [Acidimicrobiia bacterium]|nr:MerR family transcriptional regulator [Acidimicrobiia bacterium]